MVEYGLFNELDRTEGCFEAQLYSREEAEERRQEYIAEGEAPEDITIEELCPEHEGQAKNGCEQCHDEYADEDDDIPSLADLRHQGRSQALQEFDEQRYDEED